MPAPVPSGYTRGPIMFLAPGLEPQGTERLLQYFWEEAGAFGSRIALIPTGPASWELAAALADRFRLWESDTVSVVEVSSREEALYPAHLEVVTAATAVLLLGDNPLKLATMLGGTPLAQAIRRANARGKAVAGYGAGAALLCEHMIAFDTTTTRPREHPEPFLHRHRIQFSPGLGITNRVVLDSTSGEVGQGWDRLARLLEAVAYNPFLVGLALERDTGAVIYPDNTLEVFGAHSALIVDGAGMSHTDVHEYRRPGPLSVLGVQIHALGPGYTFNLQDRTAHPPPASDIPERGVPDWAEME